MLTRLINIDHNASGLNDLSFDKNVFTFIYFNIQYSALRELYHSKQKQKTSSLRLPSDLCTETWASPGWTPEDCCWSSAWSLSLSWVGWCTQLFHESETYTFAFTMNASNQFLQELLRPNLHFQSGDFLLAVGGGQEAVHLGLQRVVHLHVDVVAGGFLLVCGVHAGTPEKNDSELLEDFNWLTKMCLMSDKSLKKIWFNVEKLKLI